MIIRLRRCNSSRAVIYADLIIAELFLAIVMAVVKRETVHWSFLRDIKSLIERVVHFKGHQKWEKTVHRNSRSLASRFPSSRGPLKGDNMSSAEVDLQAEKG